MKDLKVYSREVTKRVAINRFGKLGFRDYIEYVVTNDVSIHNYRKQHKFIERDITIDELKDKLHLKNIEVDKVYEKENY